MRGRRALRFVVEALFLGALAVALGFADLGAPAIAGVMLLGWLVVALFEWAATRELPHYGRGLPPRYYVPQVSLPPPRPLDQLGSRYPAADLVDEEPTWIASPAMRAEMLAEWPVEAGAPAPPSEDTIVDGLPFVSLPDERGEDARPELEAAEPAPEPEVVEAMHVEVEPEPVAAAAAAAVVVAEPESVEEPEVVAEEEGPEAAPAPPRPARHTFDPLARASPGRRRWRRQSRGDEAFAEVSASPPRAERLPSRLRSDD